jgi:ankyrin repeat protein
MDLIEACLRNRVEKVKLLLQCETPQINLNKLLINASVRGYLEVVKLLVENGASIQFKNYRAINWANNNGHLEVESYLKKQLLLKKINGLNRRMHS